LRDKKIQKQYACLVCGIPEAEEGVVSAKLLTRESGWFRTFVSPRGKPATTRWCVPPRGRIREQPNGDRKTMSGDKIMF
jgi:23S rRNA-/tRNA-specific pseudouridylate synthase